MLRSRIFPGLLVLLLLAGSALALGRVWAQGDEPLPPHVIDVWPLPGVELAPDEALTVTFDQPVDAASVEAAFVFDPPLAGSFAWSDARTVNFTPQGGWPRAMTYTVTVGTGATAANGLALEDPYVFEAQTVGALVVAAVTPEAGTEGVAADARIVVTFNRPVVPLVSTQQLADLPSPLTIEPAVAGTGEWLNTAIYVFTPAEPLRGGTTYTARVPAGLQSVTGAVLDEGYSWSFRTLPPQIFSISPGSDERGVLLDRPVTVTFSQPMDHASTEEAFYLLYGGERVTGTFSWSEDSTVLIFTPSDLLRIDSVYTINIAQTARSTGGDATLNAGQSHIFYTVPYPDVDRTSPANGEFGVQPGGGASIYFRSPMNTDTFEGRIAVFPESAEWHPSVWSNQALGINFVSLPNTTYTITLRAGTEDIYGNAITTDYTFSYTTGDIATWAYPLTNYGQLALTGSYREDTRMSMYVSGRPTVDFQLYEIGAADLNRVLRGGYYYSDQLAPWATPDRLVRSWSQTFDSEGLQGVAREVLLASENGGVLPNGVYWLVIRAPNTNAYQFALGVVNANLTIKRAPGEALIWVTDMPSGSPLLETTVTIYHQGQAIARGQTDADGIFRAPVDVPTDDTFVYVTAEGPGVYGVWYSYNAPSLPERQGYLYTDRPIYRPGQTVYFRGVLRDRQDMTYSVPNLRQVGVTIYDAAGRLLHTSSLPVTDFGTFSGELLLPEDAALGDGYISTDYGASVSFTIAEFRVPEFQVTVTPQQDEIFQGQPLNALVETAYYFGGAVSGAAVQWTAYGSSADFNYTGPGRYSFYDETWDTFYSFPVGNGSATTDANGRFLITSENTRPPVSRPMSVTVEATITDESGQAISGRSSVLAHPANIYVGLRSDRYFGREGQPMDIGLIAVTAQSEPIPDKRIDLSVIEIRWSRVPIEGQFGRYQWQQEEIEVETAQVTTGPDGAATYTFTPPVAGIYRVRASALDEYERRNGSTLRFWVTGSRPVWWGEPSETIDLIADQETYQVGDTAQILIPIPFAGRSTVLVSVERAGVMRHEVLRVEGSTLLYELPITEADVPTAHFTVTLVKGVDEESANPDYRTGQIALNVEPVERRLTVAITPSVPMAQPRDTVSFDVLATDAHGEPVQAEFGLALTDKAILSLMPPNSGTLEDTFYGYQPDYVYTDVSMTSLLDRLTDQAVGLERGAEEAAGEFIADSDMVAMAPMAAVPTATAQGLTTIGGGQQPVTVREEFEQTPLWNAHVVTGPDGRATVSVALPDNLTTWQLDARALTIATEVGQATAEVMATLPLLVRPVAPRFFVVGDRVQLAAVINNNTGAAQTVQATLQAEGVTLESDATQSVTIEAAARARVEWTVVAEDVSYVDLTFIAIGADGYQDATRPTLATGPDGTIPVYRYTAPDTVGTGGILREGGSRTESISLPPRLDADQGELTVRLDPSLAVAATDAFDYLRNFPHQCIEQTVSRFLPNVRTYRALRDLGLNDPELEANLYTVLEDALDKLSAEQRADGGWGWFYDMESDPLVTAYALLGLAEARDADFEVDFNMIDRAAQFVLSDLMIPVTIDTPAWRLNRQAFYLYALAKAGGGNLNSYLELHNFRLEMSYAGRAYLLMAFLELYPEQGAVADLVSDLTTGARLSATGAHWEEEYNDWWNWSSDTRTTAIVLSALIRAMPQSDLLPNAVRWLMVGRQGDHWETTQETAWAVMALTDWMVLTGELRGSYDYSLSVNRVPLTQATVTPETVREGQVLHVAVRDLLREEINRVVVARSEGEGALYYTAHLNLRLPAAEVDAISRGITVTREYFLADDPDRNPITEARVGDTITVRLTITLPEDIYYFVLEDPIPAGTEGVDTSLLTTSHLIEGPELQRQWERDPNWYRWYWGWWWFDRTELRDEEARLYADFLPRGTYTYTYQVRASIPGEFQTMPSHAYAFYFPEVFGRTDGTLFTVLPASAD